MRMKRIVALGAAAAMLVSSTFLMDTSAFRVRAEESAEKTGNAVMEQVESNGAAAALKETEALSESLGLLTEATVKDDDMVRVIVTLRDASILEANSSATANSSTDKKSATLEAKQEKVIEKIEDTVLDGETLDVHYKYTWLLNGFAASVPYGRIDEIKKIAGVENVILQPVYTVCETTKSDADIQTIYDGVMVGREEAWETGYTGKGMKIAVIDTGIDEDHPSFAALPESSLTETSATQASVNKVLGQLNASYLYPNLSVSDVYYSTKIAFGFNYVDANTKFNHAYDEEGDHGTHVAGIAAANNLGEGKVVGVAPDAQLYVMKVFGANGGAYTEDILAAIEDALILDADVINMSLGSPAGFTSDGDIIDEIYASVSETDTILAIAAGNAGSMGQGNLWGTDKNLTENPDNSTVSSPATYGSATSVASVENVAVQSYYFEAAGNRYSYNECVNSVSELALTIAGTAYPFVVVDNYGQTLEDFAGVEGKIAVVSRGIVSFGSKAMLAEQAGAVACIVYNNTNENINMDMTGATFSIPCVSVSMKTGAALVAAYAEDPNATIEFSSEQAGILSEDAYTMSTFSSWGAAPDLSLVPDVAAPGGNIYSCYDGGSYGLMSGTSMATPNMAGVSALVMQYAREAYPEMSDAELHNFVNALIVSTATPLKNADGLTYSPRLQGSGLVNAYNSIMTTAFLSVAGMDVPKVELKDDPEKKGSYHYSFMVNNFGETDQWYDVRTTAQTENVDLTYAAYGFTFIDETPRKLSPVISHTYASENYVFIYDYTEDDLTRSDDARWLYLAQLDNSVNDKNDFFRYDLDTDEDSDRADVQAYLDALVEKTDTTDVYLETQKLRVKAGEEVKLSVDVSLQQRDKDYLDTYFENGIYVEGYTFLNACALDGVDLSLPYMAFYGDWTQAPILDSGYYWESDEEIIANQYYNVLFTNLYGQGSQMYPGVNPFFDETFNPANISVSPNGDGNFDYIDDIYVSLLRNAKELSFTYSNAETGEVYYDLSTYHERKSYYVDAYGICVPFVYSWLLDMDDPGYLFTDKNGDVLPNNTKVKLTVHATLDYDEHASNNLSDTWETVITVDTEAPTVTGASFVEEGGRRYLDLTFGDNVGVAAIIFTDATGAKLLDIAASDAAEPGTLHTQRFDVTGYGDSFRVFFDDYALNEIGYMLTYQP